MAYDANEQTRATRAEREAAIGSRAELRLTGRIVSAHDSNAGGFVRFEVDERWGLGALRLGMDLEAFEIEDDR